MSTLIEDRYRALVDAMTPAEKIHRMWTLSAWAREMLARRIEAEEGPMSVERLKWRTALRIYGGDSQTRRMIEEHLKNVPD